MKKIIALIAVAVLLTGTMNVLAQEQPKPAKDTVNMDTYAKPEKFYEIEDDAVAESGKGGKSGLIIAIIAGVVVVAGVAGYLITRKKK